jgi:hypothetical protein
MSQAPTAKLQPTQSNEPDPAKTSGTAAPAAKDPAQILEEDDEFEDFPVEGAQNPDFNGQTRTLEDMY